MDSPTSLYSKARHILALCILVGVCGCFPAITHGARVEDGFIAGVTAGSASGDEHVEGDEGGIRLRQPVIGPFVGWGAASTRPGLPGFYLGAAVPLLFPLAQVDAYLQLPPAWTGPLSAGAGVIANLEGATGYGMIGGQFNPTTAWHFGAGYGSRQSTSRFQSSSPALVGSAAIEMASGYLRTQIFTQFATGESPGSCSEIGTRRTCTRGERTSAMTLGISLGRHQNHSSR